MRSGVEEAGVDLRGATYKKNTYICVCMYVYVYIDTGMYVYTHVRTLICPFLLFLYVRLRAIL